MRTFSLKKRRGLGAIWWTIVILIILGAMFPIQVDGYVKEYYTLEKIVMKKELKKTIDCDCNIGNNKEKDWSLTDLGENLRIIVDISSTEDIILKVESKNGIEINNRNRIFLYNCTMEGPSLVIELQNPWEMFGEKAELHGSIKIYHEYYKNVQTTNYTLKPGKVWTIWWMRILFE